MCRLLAVISRTPIDARSHLDAFTRVCRNSSEYQGHGWGYALLHADGWEQYRTVSPIWEDAARPNRIGHVLLAHARSAFRDEGIVVENAMPFIDGDQVFVFNGELHGVRLPVQGRTGAERIFRFLRQPARLGADAVERSLGILRSRSTHIRACNLMLADRHNLILYSAFAGVSAYFTMHQRRTDEELTICSAPYDTGRWTPIPRNTVEVFPCSF
jgi:predicted glutamine amidotransferase